MKGKQTKHIYVSKHDDQIRCRYNIRYNNTVYLFRTLMNERPPCVTADKARPLVVVSCRYVDN